MSKKSGGKGGLVGAATSVFTPNGAVKALVAGTVTLWMLAQVNKASDPTSLTYKFGKLVGLKS